MVLRPFAAIVLFVALAWLAFNFGRGLGHLSTPTPHGISDIDLALPLDRLVLSPRPAHDAAAAAPSNSEASQASYYASEATRDFCAAHGYQVFVPPSPPSRRKVFDLFMANSELDLIEIRLATLYNHVDYFVIVESLRTFQGRPKPLVVRDNWQRFSKFHDKIIYHVLEFPAGFAPRLTWDYEDLQRDASLEQVLPRLTGSQAPVEGDVIIVADVDEIPRPAALLVLRSCIFPRRLTLSSRFYYYSYQFRHMGADWPHPQATIWQGSDKTIRPTKLRASDGGSTMGRILESGTLQNAGWHCSSCFATIGDFLNKMASFSHMWMNEPKYRDVHRIAAAVRQGRDVWGRRQDVFERIDNNEDVPPPLLTESGRRRFGYMLSRDGESAGFSDYP
ncbi:hypothetical protein CDD81_6056 [Ophiocordyceps australis]|uniref:Beta-1,4-mannosyl-glycoprotein 4-beta-N-acetylglucosaminyltransferase n=1 Tax=Ophiocordyceps australis TaxID=1399860 RepID=A0A2C5X9P9_9HYPO|nr:hypothetical protein CDD81_6056 [Ophiocordyceps australis]